MYGLTGIDIALIVVYFVGMIVIGLWSSHLVKNQEDYFLGGRRFGKMIQTFAAFGQGTSVDTAVAVITTTITNGASGIWSSMIYLFATPFYWLVSPWMRRLRTLTLADFFEERYNSKAIAAFYAVVGSIGMMAMLSVGFVAMVKTIVPLSPKPIAQLTVVEQQEYQLSQELEELKATDYKLLTDAQKTRMNELAEMNPRNLFSYINENMLIWVVCIVTIIYVLFGGLVAAFLTDMVQGIFIIILSIMMLPFGFAKVNQMYGGSGVMGVFKTMHAQLPESFFEIFGSPNTIDFTWYYIAALAVMGMLNVIVQPNVLVATGSAKDEHSARFGFVAGNFMKRFCIVGWGVFALVAVILYHDKVSNPDLVWGYATQDLLGPLGMGLVGLMIACLLSALMSTATTLMLTCAGLITRNIYHPLLPNKSVRHYMWVGRISSVLIIVGSAMIALKFETILQILKFIWEFNVVVAASFWLGMKWRRANKIGAWASMVITFLIFFVISIFLPVAFPSLRTHPELLKKTEPVQLVRSYQAKPMDVSQREKEIAAWYRLQAAGKAEGMPPNPIQIGQTFEKRFTVAGQGVFWTQGVKTDLAGSRYGKGDFNLELYLLDKAGFDLSQNPYALNETIRLIIRTMVPFLSLIIVSLLTRPDDKVLLDKFFVKMKTKVLLDKAQDAAAMEASCAAPHRFDHLKLFPKSNWEFDKWDKDDTVGFLGSIGVVIGILVLLKLLVSIGG
jgi:SSS family solute:Na+ symporter